MRLFPALTLLLCAMAAQADMIASVDDADIDEMQTVQLTVRITGTNQADDFDLDALTRDFEVQSTTTQSQFRSVNGRVSSWVEYHVTLRPLRTGQLLIPALSYRGEQSNPITVQVRSVSADMKKEIDRLVYFDVSIDKPEVYVQAQLVLTRRLYYTVGVQIYGDLPGAPDLPDAVVLPLGEATSEATMLGNRRYGVLEQRYAIFPERSGTLTIPGFSVTSSVRLADRGRRGVRVHAEAKTVNVLPVPDTYPKELPWFPAEDVQLRERWDPHAAQMNAGDSIQRTIIVRAEGAIGSVVPPVTANMPDSHFKQYSRPPEIEDEASGKKAVVGTRRQLYDLIVTHGGQVTTPSVSLTWWDTGADTLRTSTLKGRALRLIGDSPAEPRKAAEAAPEATRSDSAEPADATEIGLPWQNWLMVAVGLLVAFAAFWFVLSWYRARPANPFSTARKEVRSATTFGGLQQALARYAAHRWRARPAEALTLIRERTAHGSDLLSRLNRAGYAGANERPSAFEADCLNVLQEIRAFREEHGKVDALPPLYPG